MCISLTSRKVIKRDGRVVDFDKTRIEKAITKAMKSVNKYDKEALERALANILNFVETIYQTGKTPTVEQIQDIVELSLMKEGLFDVAKSYILYRKERESIREEKKGILKKDALDEVDKNFSTNSLRLMASRYLLKNEKGELIETPKQMFQRVSALVVIPDILFSEKVFNPKGGESIKPESSSWSLKEWSGKVGLKREDGTYAFLWNEHHLERMKALYDELNHQGKAKISWDEFFSSLLKGEFDSFVTNFDEYYNLMVQKKFLPNSPTLFNAGTRLGQLSACFVLDIDDDMESIMRTATEAAIIFKSGGGVGVNYSKLRPAGDIVSSTSGVASGPVSFMRIIDVITDVVKQGGRRRGANMGILNINHPDIEKFITCKLERGKLENFNISVLLTDDFWDALNKNGKIKLINPRDGKVWNEVEASKLLDLIATTAWRTGDPGVVMFDNINKHNVLKSALGPIYSTNPCGEEPLYPNESCNLGSINLLAFVEESEDGKPFFNWEEYKRTIKTALRFLDNVLDVNKFPLKEIEERTKETRKVGLGLMGLADMLFLLEVPYNSEEGFELMEALGEHLTYFAMWASTELAKERGKFPLYDVSGYVKGEMPTEGYYSSKKRLDWEALKERIKLYGMRNAEVTTIAPTGSISMLADTSSGIEPLYALVYEKRVSVGTFYYVDEVFKNKLKSIGMYNERLLKEINDQGGSIQDIEEIPIEVRKVFQTALDIPWWDHVRAQACFSKWITAATSKTINMPSWVKPEDVKNAYIFAHALGVKGVTIYRDGSLPSQVLVAPSSRKGSYSNLVSNKTLDILRSLGIEVSTSSFQFAGLSLKKQSDPVRELVDLQQGKEQKNNNSEKCPVCGSSRIVVEGGCKTCLDCGWSYCPVA